VLKSGNGDGWIEGKKGGTEGKTIGTAQPSDENTKFLVQINKTTVRSKTTKPDDQWGMRVRWGEKNSEICSHLSVVWAAALRSRLVR